MAIWDKLRGEIIDIIEWLTPDNDRETMVYRFQRYDNEIKYGAKLIVREGQMAAFVNEGQLADVFNPGTYTLETKNLPILATLKGWKYGFSSPFKAEVYFVSTRIFTDRKWGTKNPIMLRDPEFGPTRLRAFGTFAVRIFDVPVFLRQIVGTDGRFSIEEIGEQLRDMLVARFADALGEAKLPALDLAAHQDEIGHTLLGRVNVDFAAMGLEIASLVVENISLPEEVEKALDKRTSMGVIGNLDAFAKFQAAQAMEKAAENPSGMAGMGAGMGAGFAMANEMGRAMSGAMQPGSGGGVAGKGSGNGSESGMGAGASSPPPVPGSEAYYIAVNGQQQGTFGLDQLRQKASAGELTRATLVWRAGMPQWQPAEHVSELKALFAAMPPPLPE